MSEVVLRVDRIAKSFGAARVLTDVSFELHAGEVLALTGENGAGKSTLSKIICGLEQPSSGAMSLAGAPHMPRSRTLAERAGVRMVLQELGLIPTLTVAENLLIDRLPNRASWVDRSALAAQARAQLARVGLTQIDPMQPVAALGIGQQQMVEIARNLQDGTRVLILDEPTAMLTPREIEQLFREIEQMKARGVAVIYISHRLDEVLRIADTLAVLRDGALVSLRPMRGVTETEIVQAMVGHEVDDHAERPARPAGAAVLRAEGLGRGQAVRDLDFTLHAGEVLGLAGLVGSGRTEALRLLFGADRADRGQLTLVDGERVAYQGRGWRSPQQAIAAGLGLVTEDRKSQGLLLPQSVRVNTTLGDLSAFTAGLGWLRQRAERSEAGRWVDTLRVRCTGPEQPVGTLSGGNQQKVVFARWLRRDCKVLLLDEPTRGVDVGARADLYAQLDAMAAAGKALLVVSSDLRELMAMSDRIGVMSGGRLVAIFKRGEWTQQGLLEAAFSETGGAAASRPAPVAAH